MVIRVEPGTARDFIGYGADLPRVEWPGGARVAVSLCLNYEEGAEHSLLDGDSVNEWVGEISYTPTSAEHRDLSQESVYEYGSRAGAWRLLRLFDRTQTPVTVYGCAEALARNRPLTKAFVEAGHEICSHGLRWREPSGMTEDEERAEIRQAVATITELCGERPVGWYSRYAPSDRTRRLLVEEGGFRYDSNAYNDDLPYWVQVAGQRHLVLPYTHTYNDGRFAFSPGYGNPTDFFENCRRGIEYLWEEGETSPKMISIGLHARLIGQAGRASALRDLIAWAQDLPGVWFARRRDIADWWHHHYSDLPAHGGQ
ncbi:polysaccharide deacetylase family protein [Micromonospora matsumotoense]|uniref:Peptidoglycan/xylan/chitin deacetylase, PgdA/CDA1 family n=1 Tax=Micromonospora matsumotoense TaxID=121616 RepID=A0A1C4V3D8_9ACTN|nr:polysaccharide deacetylase family protein [Micromonospora matsumotoense]SCE78361.1 Peptidoglycan/xylan/chitin deacetylase, PgdA/CDA1 family [Micromonospora matsumotoense]